jgi:hypothetical protein
MTTFFALFTFSILVGTAMTALFWPLLWICGVFEAPAPVRRALPQIFGRKTNVQAPTRTVKV